MIRVSIKASSAIVKAGLESLLKGNPALRLAGDPAGRARETRSTTESPPDVLLLEAETLADNSVREAMDRALAGGPVVILVRNPALEPVADALRAGVKAVLPSGLTALEIMVAIEAAAAGLVVMHGSDLESLLPAASTLSGGRSETLVEALTPREIEVLRLLAGGFGNKEIASRLDISEHTVKFHVASIMGKLGAASRTEAVTLGIRHGLILI
jgi:two-component system, NarL family, response regulator YdfI